MHTLSLLEKDKKKDQAMCLSYVGRKNLGRSLIYSNKSSIKAQNWPINIITREDNVFLYDNIQHKKKKRQWSDEDESPMPTPKVGFQGRKLCIWWDHRGIIHFEFLNHNQTLSANLHPQNLQRVHENLS